MSRTIPIVPKTWNYGDQTILKHSFRVPNSGTLGNSSLPEFQNLELWDDNLSRTIVSELQILELWETRVSQSSRYCRLVGSGNMFLEQPPKKGPTPPLLKTSQNNHFWMYCHQGFLEQHLMNETYIKLPSSEVHLQINYTFYMKIPS